MSALDVTAWAVLLLAVPSWVAFVLLYRLHALEPDNAALSDRMWVQMLLAVASSLAAFLASTIVVPGVQVQSGARLVMLVGVVLLCDIPGVLWLFRYRRRL